MSSRSALTCETCQRAFNDRSPFAAARKAASLGLRSLGAWMRIAATDSRNVSGGVGVSSLILRDDCPYGGRRALRRPGERQDDALPGPIPRHARARVDGPATHTRARYGVPVAVPRDA